MFFPSPTIGRSAADIIETTQSLPAMTSNGTPSGYSCSASSSYDSGTGDAYPAYLAFDQNTSDPSSWLTTNATVPAWVRRDLPSGIKVGAYALRCRAGSGADQMPTNWIIQGSNDGVAWTDLDAKAAQSWTNNGERRVYTIPPGVRATFSKYRFVINANGGAAYHTLVELELLKEL